jgi:hypothetical protein
VTKKEEATLTAIRERWDTKKRGTYIDRHNQRTIYALEKEGLVEVWPFTREFGFAAYPKGAR